jgi:hypothetical protein
MPQGQLHGGGAGGLLEGHSDSKEKEAEQYQFIRGDSLVHIYNF